MSKLKIMIPTTCRICGREIQCGEPYEWAKVKGSTIYVHTDCTKKEGGRKDGRT